MISKVTITDPNKTVIDWLPKVKSIVTFKEFEFTPGINILWGTNGSGKSTLLKLIARMFHAEQGRFSTVTEYSMSEIFDILNKKDISGVTIDHDGQAVAFHDPSRTIGLIGGAFDDDFFSEGMQSIMNKGSAGQLSLHNLGGVLKKVKDNKSFPPSFKIKKEYVNSLWKERIQLVEKFFKPSIPLGKITCLLDEPERSFDIPTQKELWKGIENRMGHVQLIIATHSVFACNIKNANYIEFTPGYLEQCRKALKDF